MNWLDALPALLGYGAVAFVLAELLARLWLSKRGKYFVFKPGTTTLMQVDQKTFPDLPIQVRFAINAAGERGGSLPRTWKNTYRVLVAGGSAAECYLLDQEVSWPQVLQSHLNPRASELGATRVHVGSISRSLVPCECLATMLRHALPGYERLDLVILMVGASDVVNWLEQKTPATLERGRMGIGRAFDVHPEGPFGWTLATLALRRIASFWYHSLGRPVEHREGAGKTIAKNRLMRANAREILDEVPDPTPMVEYFEAGFRDMVTVAKSHAKRVLVVRQPWLAKDFTPAEQARLWNFGAGRPYVEEVTTYYAHHVVDSLMQRLDASQERICTELDVEQLDLMPHLERSFETYYDFLHFTPKGSKRVGELIGERVVQPTVRS